MTRILLNGRRPIRTLKRALTLCRQEYESNTAEANDQCHTYSRLAEQCQVERAKTNRGEHFALLEWSRVANGE